jgi:hypothetical protein
MVENTSENVYPYMTIGHDSESVAMLSSLSTFPKSAMDKNMRRKKICTLEITIIATM